MPMFQSVNVFNSSIIGAGSSASVINSQGFQGVLFVSGTIFQGGDALMCKGPNGVAFCVSTSKVFANGAVFMPMYFPAGEYHFLHTTSSSINVHVSFHPTP